MNEISETWHLPWHALQKNLALGLSVNAGGHSLPTLKSVRVQSVSVSAKSWLSRVRHSAAPSQTQ